jgi:hypothetical protein
MSVTGMMFSFSGESKGYFSYQIMSGPNNNPNSFMAGNLDRNGLKLFA